MFMYLTTAADAGIVDQNIYGFEGRDGGLDDPLHIFSARNVCLDRQTVATDLSDCFECAFNWPGTPATHDDPRAFTRQGERYALPNATPAACNTP